MSIADEKEALTDIIKASVTHSGALANLKGVSYADASASQNDELPALKQQAQTAIDDIQQMLNAGKLDQGNSQKLMSVLAKLRSALGKDTISPGALTLALSEAATAIGTAEDAGNTMTPQQKAEQLWQRVEADTKDIDDDFAKMRRAGVIFNDNLWNRHQQLTEYLLAHPHDLATQKELDAADDALLMQAEPQIGQCPDAKSSFDDAKTKSKGRHQLVDKALSTFDKGASMTAMDFADDKSGLSTQSASQNISLADVKPPTVGQNNKNTGKLQSL